MSFLQDAEKFASSELNNDQQQGGQGQGQGQGQNQGDGNFGGSGSDDQQQQQQQDRGRDEPQQQQQQGGSSGLSGIMGTAERTAEMGVVNNELNEYATKAGIPGSADGVIDAAVDQEAGQFMKDM